MLRICLIGPGDVDFHFNELLKIPKKKLDKHLNEISESLTKTETILLPDKGICFDVAKKLRKLTDSRIIGTLPLSDKDFGIKHLKEYVNAKTGNKKVFDGFVDTKSWYRQQMLITTFGDVVLMLGNSLGSLYELTSGFYIYKLLQKQKEKVKVSKKTLHKEIRAGTKIPFTVIVYKPFFKNRLDYEIEAYIKRSGGRIHYIKNAKELRKILDNNP